MFFIFLLINFFYKARAFHNFFLFYCLNKNLMLFFDSFLTNRFLKDNVSIKRNLILNKKFKKSSSVKFKSFRISRRKLRLYLKLKNKTRPVPLTYTPFLHNFFFTKIKAIKSSAIFLTHRKISNFSNFLIVNNLVNPNVSHFYFKSMPTLESPSCEQTLIFSKKSKNNSYRLKAKLFSKKLKKNNIYRFLENNEYRFNKEKNFYFINSHYSRFTLINRKIKKKKYVKPPFNRLKFIKLLSSPLFVKKFKKTTFLFKALFKYFPKKFFRARQTTFGFLRRRPYFFL